MRWGAGPADGRRSASPGPPSALGIGGTHGWLVRSAVTAGSLMGRCVSPAGAGQADRRYPRYRSAASPPAGEGLQGRLYGLGCSGRPAGGRCVTRSRADAPHRLNGAALIRAAGHWAATGITSGWLLASAVTTPQWGRPACDRVARPTGRPELPLIAGAASALGGGGIKAGQTPTRQRRLPRRLRGIAPLQDRMCRYRRRHLARRCRGIAAAGADDSPGCRNSSDAFASPRPGRWSSPRTPKRPPKRSCCAPPRLSTALRRNVR